MNQPTAGFFMHDTIYGWNVLSILWAIVPATVAVGLGARYWRFFVQWLNGIRGHDWPAVSAIIDIVSVVQQDRGRREGPAYLATLTYFYRNPELQTGEYSCLFEEEADAQAWAASYKGCTVMVHADPRDPSRSVLRKEDL